MSACRELEAPPDHSDVQPTCSVPLPDHQRTTTNHCLTENATCINPTTEMSHRFQMLVKLVVGEVG